MSAPNILVVDDEPLNQQLMNISLGHLGCRVDLAGNGLEALAAFQKQDYDLIFMDLDMPEMDGLETIRQIRRRHVRHIPIVVCSSYMEEITAARCKAVGADDYLGKPLHPQDLVDKLNKWLPRYTFQASMLSFHGPSPVPVRLAGAPADDLARLFAHADIALIFKALHFSAEKHRHQRRKDLQASPYINHPIEVAKLLWCQGGVDDVLTVVGALLHDTIEDTQTTADELRTVFSAEVAALVAEVSDDRSLPAEQRKRLQIEHAPHISRRAKHIKLADKICNVIDVTHAPPHNWTVARRRQYLDWTVAVIAGLRGCLPELEAYYDQVLQAGYAALEQAQ